ncbi:D-Ala-D-Ala carboxypeptidase family metallohydrolase [Caulobacter sp. BP25]|uniref:D-Ala-D-Ala carboxypeptidase family metallohydrolase n=1 Tax=Caulobacter sp. BP25 TaxID=2048900 RepID=UPI000C12E178|nr:D-Ala-D-Ala carboxypeptidase family metallohydrolase [Caulobacter sp. BP25]PHY20942.1 peptidase M15 [Caulobacter sp. BP25]
MHMSEHFTLAEMTVSANAARLGLDNTPPPEIIARLKTVAQQLERIRELLGGKPIRITSCYRSPDVNRAAGGAKASAHLEGWAVDFVCPDYGTPLQIAERLERSAITFDQLIHEHGVWVHISFDPRRRGQLLTIDRGGTREGLHEARS